MKKNEHVVGTCLGYTSDGLGVVKIEGFPLFVKGMLKGETGELVVTLSKKSYGFARLLKLSQRSKERVEPKCSIASQCGGCQLQHLSYKEQLSFKKQKIQDVMDRIAKLDVPVMDVLGMEQCDAYRNKGQIPVGIRNNRVVTGFYRINSNDIIDTEHCMIQSDRINEVLVTMRSLLNQFQNALSFRHLLIKHGIHTDEVMVVWIVKERKLLDCDKMVEALIKACPFVKSIIMNINKRDDNVILGEEEVVLFGKPYIVDTIHGLQFHISSKSFYQVNPIQTEVLYGKALEFCLLSGNETVIDLYCGVGTISMFLAQKAKEVIGIEIVPEAIEDAKLNASINKIENIEFVCSDAATYAKMLCDEGKQVDVVVVDPPRKGCDVDTLESIVKMEPKRIVYVSCDPATLARDLAILDGLGYKAELVQGVDMFKYSHHIESVVRLTKTK